MSEIINRIRMGNYSSWGEARGIPVKVKEARGKANKGKWNDDFGQDFCAISNFVSVRWFDGEWQPGYFIMGITDNGTVQGTFLFLFLCLFVCFFFFFFFFFFFLHQCLPKLR
jgi:hypothetical protein